MRPVVRAAVVAGLVLGALPARAVEIASSGAPGPFPAAGPSGPFASRPVPRTVLASQRGGDAATLGTQLQGSVADNTVSQSVTGSNTIGSGAFAGVNGVATVIQNTGNNVLIQNAVVVNVQLK